MPAFKIFHPIPAVLLHCKEESSGSIDGRRNERGIIHSNACRLCYDWYHQFSQKHSKRILWLPVWFVNTEYWAVSNGWQLHGSLGTKPVLHPGIISLSSVVFLECLLAFIDYFRSSVFPGAFKLPSLRRQLFPDCKLRRALEDHSLSNNVIFPVPISLWDSTGCLLPSRADTSVLLPSSK